MPGTYQLPTRQIHLDFHTGPDIGDVASRFDAKAFARTIRKAHVNSVTVFAKCHHGLLYYNTRRAERHPGLKAGFDLLRKQVDALHAEGIRAPIYISVLCDEYAANTHPEWIARNPDGTNVGSLPLAGTGWQIMDMSSPYQDYLAEQTQEVLRLFKPVDGIFFDMCWDQPSVSIWAKTTMLKAGLDPESDEDRKTYAHQVSLAYMKRFYKLVKDNNPDAGVFFNARDKIGLSDDVKYMAQIEIEALPTGGWGYVYFPTWIRHARTFDLPLLGMTGRFHRSWADFGGLKPYPALEYETSQMIAQGAYCSIGDQLHPRGVLDPAAYALIGEAYARIEAAEPWITDAKAQTDIALLTGPRHDSELTGSDEGAVRMLTQLGHQFNLLRTEQNFDRYKLVIASDNLAMDDKLIKRLQSYLKKGGALLFSGTSGLSADGKSVLLPQLGIKALGPSPFKDTYIRFGKRIDTDVPASDHVIYDRGIRVTAPAAQTLARVVEPYFDRSWKHFSSHFQTPPDKLSRYAAATLKGRVGYIAYPIFSTFANYGNYPYRLLVGNMIDLLLENPLLRVDGPTNLETSVIRQSKPARTIVHLLSYSPERRTPKLDLVEDIIPVFNLPLSLRMDHKPRRVYLAPQKQELDFELLNGRINLCVPMVNGHQMVVFE